uniref:Neural chondroitin sulphate proteoglycan cytoplasmic domain-containing protein n=1 Tax=Junco hyemalis TaxID=40217 RepID=A0A8C5J2Q4_JUNHY
MLGCRDASQVSPEGQCGVCPLCPHRDSGAWVCPPGAPRGRPCRACQGVRPSVLGTVGMCPPPRMPMPGVPGCVPPIPGGAGLCSPMPGVLGCTPRCRGSRSVFPPIPGGPVLCPPDTRGPELCPPAAEAPGICSPALPAGCRGGAVPVPGAAAASAVPPPPPGPAPRLGAAPLGSARRGSLGAGRAEPLPVPAPWRSRGPSMPPWPPAPPAPWPCCWRSAPSVRTGTGDTRPGHGRGADPGRGGSRGDSPLPAPSGVSLFVSLPPGGGCPGIRSGPSLRGGRANRARQIAPGGAAGCASRTGCAPGWHRARGTRGTLPAPAGAGSRWCGAPAPSGDAEPAPGCPSVPISLGVTPSGVARSSHHPQTPVTPAGTNTASPEDAPGTFWGGGCVLGRGTPLSASPRRCNTQDYTWHKGTRCESIVTDFQVMCVAVGSAALVVLLLFMLTVFFAKKLYLLKTENSKLRKTKYRTPSELHNDNFSLSTIAEGSHPNDDPSAPHKLQDSLKSCLKDEEPFNIHNSTSPKHEGGKGEQEAGELNCLQNNLT